MALVEAAQPCLTQSSLGMNFAADIAHIQSVPSSCRPKSTAPRRRVAFLETENVPLLSTSCVVTSPQEKCDLWYQDSDYMLFGLEVRLTVAAVRRVQGNLRQLDATHFTVTGLEKVLSRRQAQSRKQTTKRHVRTIVKYQLQCRDPHELRRISEYFSKQPLHRAHLRGVLDRALL